jgi:hypothetical protein
MCQCTPRCGLLIAHQVRLNIRNVTHETVRTTLYTISYIVVSNSTILICPLTLSRHKSSKKNCLLWLSVLQAEKHFLEIWQLYLLNNHGFFMPFINMHFQICILPKSVLEIALCLLLTKMKQSTDHLRLSL